METTKRQPMRKDMKKVAYHSYPVFKERPKFFQGALKFPNNLRWQSPTFAPLGYVFAQNIVKEPILEHEAFARSESLRVLIFVALEFSHLLIPFTARNVAGKE